MAKTLIALAALAASAAYAGSPEIAAGASFDVPDDATAQKLIADGHAKEAEKDAQSVKTTAARVLAVCEYGQPNDVVDLPASKLKQAKAEGLVDDDKAAVAYARSLKPVK